jgi:hypothetical protein
MGTEMKTPESEESSLRNRKKKEIPAEKCEKSAKTPSKVATEEKTEGKVSQVKAQDDEVPNDTFRFRLEFDPMSIALFALALATRFFRLAEPRNVV